MPPVKGWRPLTIPLLYGWCALGLLPRQQPERTPQTPTGAVGAKKENYS
ncbi:hypothetical protein [Dictyobacter formicarum]|uniref:Uncharacterized protein n=1 Tax=Dictyobacter formicarum TaxID=2778368 RepID=A0ABQ3VKM1_9CHLR|nr:hypothetical protein [Dictyobacter formicarum]GHO86650.1 hypothetical protein KSZ_46560 [Dictyobacter formicarum]